MTIGDVLAVLAAVAATGTTWGAALLFLTLIAPMRVATAQKALAESPGAMALRGLGIAGVGGLIALVLSQNPNGAVKASAFLLSAGIGMLAAVGGAGIVALLGERIGGYGPHLPPFAARTRGAILYVLAGLVPVVGWLFVTPIALCLSVGAGATALMPLAKKPVPIIASSTETALDART